MAIHLQDSAKNGKIMQRIVRLATFLGISKAQAAELIIREAPLNNLELVVEEAINPPKHCVKP